MTKNQIDMKNVSIPSCDANSFTCSEQINSFSGRNVKRLICSPKMNEFASHEEVNAQMWCNNTSWRRKYVHRINTQSYVQ